MMMKHDCVFVVLVITMSKIYVALQKELFWWNTCCFSSNMGRYMQILQRCIFQSC